MANNDCRLTILMAGSLDGFIARKDGRVDWLETSDCYVMGSRTYETALSLVAKGLGWPYGDKPIFVLSSRELPRIRDTVQFYSGDLAQVDNGRLRPVFHTVWCEG